MAFLLLLQQCKAYCNGLRKPQGKFDAGEIHSITHREIQLVSRYKPYIFVRRKLTV